MILLRHRPILLHPVRETVRDWRTGSLGHEPIRVETGLVPEDFHPSRRFSPIVVLFKGPRGSGKTLAMTNLAALQARRYSYYHTPWQIQSNYWISFAARNDPFLIDSVMADPFSAKRSLLCLDEISAAFPSARSIAGVSVLFARFLEQIRKLPSEIMFTTQFPQVLMYQLLIQVNLFIDCEMHHQSDSIECYVHDYWGAWTGNDWKKPWPPRKDDCDWSFGLEHVSGMFKHYRSYEVIPPIWSQHREDIISRQYDMEAASAALNAEMSGGSAVLEPAEQPHLPAPASFLEMLNSHRGVFNILAFARKAKEMEGLENPTALKAFLSKNGFELTKVGNLVMARKRT
ncbi:MAG TPA: ATP-binding protein [Dehalococcoidia bacterium]|nr:ATP-binding protein [Dehalococcoidia bacterium]